MTGVNVINELVKPLTFVTLLCFGLCLALISTPLRAGSLYLPLNMSPEIEARVERLFVLANMAIIKRPIPVKHVDLALNRAEQLDPALVASIRRYLDRYSGRAAVTHLSIEALAFDGDNSRQFNQRGFDIDSRYEVSAAAHLLVNDHVALNIGGVMSDRAPGEESEFPEGSFLSLGWDYFQADIGYRSHWFGPFQESDMLISTNAGAMPGITLSNVVPLPLLGLQYEFFVSEMSESDGILSSENNEQRLTGKPLLAGFHLSFAPFDGFAIGFNRLLQFGGADRDDSFSSFYDAFFNVRESENIGVAGNDFGNQLSSVTTRYTFAGDFPIAVYMEYAGEDTSFSSSVHLGNTALMFGVHLPKLTEHLDLSWETAEWQNSWYANGNYADGLTHYGSVLGHWGASQSDSTAFSSSAQTLKLVWDIYDGKIITFKYQDIETTPRNANPLNAERFTLQYAQGFGNFILGAELQSGQDIDGERFNALSGFLRW